MEAGTGRFIIYFSSAKTHCTVAVIVILPGCTGGGGGGGAIFLWPPRKAIQSSICGLGYMERIHALDLSNPD
jgi:hypothetical protein